MGAGGSAVGTGGLATVAAVEDAAAQALEAPPSPSTAPSSSGRAPLRSPGAAPRLSPPPPSSSSDDGDQASGDHAVISDVSAWFRKAGLLGAVADEAARVAVQKGLHNPRRLLDQWKSDPALFDTFDCLSNDDIDDILLTPLFRSAVMQRSGVAISGSIDPFERFDHHYNYPYDDGVDLEGPRDNSSAYMMADSAYLHDLMQQQIALDTAARDLHARQQLQDDRARRILEETQSEMMEMLDYAMQMSLRQTAGGYGSQEDVGASSIFAPPLASLIGNLSLNPASCSTATATKKVVLSRFDPQMSSPLLEYSASFHSAFRRGSTGAQPAALAFAPSPRCCLSLRLEAAPHTASYLSIGIAEWSPHSGMVTGLLNGTYRCFGKTRHSWGLYDRRDTDGAEVWADGRRVGACRSLSEGDVVSVSADTSRGLADLYLNSAVVYTFGDLNCRASYVLGSTVADDHKLLVVSRDLPLPRPTLDDSAAAGGGVLAGLLAGMADEDCSDEEVEDGASPADVVRSMADITERAICSSTFVSSGGRAPTPAAAALPAVSQRARAVPLPAAAAAAPADSLREGAECVICLSAPKAVVLMPCRHLCLCEACGLSRRSVEQCPICREAVKDRFKVFV